MTRLYTTLLLTVALLCTPAAQAQVELCYCDDTLDQGYGTADELYTPYIELPAELLKPYAGNAITGVQIGLLADVTNVTLYVKNSPQDKTPLYTQKVGELPAGWNTVELTTPYNIIDNGQPLAIGYRARLSQNSALAYSKVRSSMGNLVYLNKDSRWSTIDGTFCIKVCVAGDQMPQRDLAIGTLADQRLDAADESFTLTSTVRNMGVQPVDSYSVRCYVDDSEAGVVTFERRVELNATDTFSVSLPVGFGMGKHPVRLEVCAVNGAAVEVATNNTAEATLTLPDPRFARMVVCEEFTGNWCGWCPRGMVGLELMTEWYGDRFIPVAVHGGGSDPLEVPRDSSYAYAPLTDSFDGAPSCTVNRRLKGDPYYDIVSIYQMETRAENHVACWMSAQWNAEGTAIDLTLTAITDVDMDNAQLQAAFILLEDSITGYYQTNYYANDPGTEFYGWESRPQYVMDLVYDDIARGCFPSFDGMSLAQGRVNAGQEYSVEYSLPIPPAVINPRQLHVVGIVIDHRTGFIQNAARLWPEGELPQAIQTVCAETATRHYYDLQGRPVAHPAAGQLLISSDR